MKRNNATRSWALAALLLAPGISVVAADDPARRVTLEDPIPVDKNRVGLSYRAAFNITARFKNVGNVGGGGRGPGPATGGDIDRFYDDGYNRVDISGNKDGLTWFWGYQNASQVPGNDTLVMHSSSPTAVNTKPIDDDPQNGFELTYSRELGRSEKKDWRWGVEAGAGWSDINIRDDRPLASGVRTIADAYNLGGVVPPPGHSGTFEGPGPLIEDRPNRTITTSPSGSVILGARQFDADLFTLRFGPYLEIPIDDRFTFSLSVGPAVGFINGEFKFNQQVSTGGTSKRQTGSGSESDVLWGGFAAATIRYAINDRWSAFVGGQYLGLTDYHAKAGGQEIELTLGRTALFTLGVGYTF